MSAKQCQMALGCDGPNCEAILVVVTGIFGPDGMLMQTRSSVRVLKDILAAGWDTQDEGPMLKHYCPEHKGGRPPELEPTPLVDDIVKTLRKPEKIN